MDIEAWISAILTNRADQSWTPELFASPDVAEIHPTLAGYAVNTDEDLNERTLEIRIAGSGELAASYGGLL